MMEGTTDETTQVGTTKNVRRVCIFYLFELILIKYTGLENHNLSHTKKKKKTGNECEIDHYQVRVKVSKDMFF